MAEGQPIYAHLILDKSWEASFAVEPQLTSMSSADIISPGMYGSLELSIALHNVLTLIIGKQVIEGKSL